MEGKPTVHRPFSNRRGDGRTPLRAGVSCCGEAMPWSGDVAHCRHCGFSEDICGLREVHGLDGGYKREEVRAYAERQRIFR